MAYKWISKRVSQLDAEKDYDEIWKLLTAYRPNDFIMNFVYAVTFPHFYVEEYGAIALVDNGIGKVLTKPDKRADDTSWKMQTWWHYGSTHPETIRNIDQINKLHGIYEKKYPGSFGHDDVMIYTICYEAAGMHRLSQRVGLRGFDEKAKLVAAKFWGNVMPHFKNLVTGNSIPNFPTTFDGIMQTMDEYERRAETLPVHEAGVIATDAVLRQFCDRYFPRWMHPLIRKWIISLYPDHLLRLNKLEKPFGRWFYRRFTAAFLWFGEHIAPDPETTFIERRNAAKEKRKSEQKSAMEGQKTGSAPTCPFSMGKKGDASQNSSDHSIK